MVYQTCELLRRRARERWRKEGKWKKGGVNSAVYTQTLCSYIGGKHAAGFFHSARFATKSIPCRLFNGRAMQTSAVRRMTISKPFTCCMKSVQAYRTC